MKIGIIGAGNIGSALARRLAPQGHEIRLSYSRDPGKLAEAARAFGATAATVRDAVAFADVVALAVPWAAVDDALAQAGALDGRLLWDCTNPLLPDLSGLAIGTTTSGGEEIARRASGARVVKGIPPFAELLHSDDPRVNGAPAEVFVAGDAEADKRIVGELLAALPARVIDAGPLQASRTIEPAMLLLVQLAYARGMGARIAMRIDAEAAR